MRWLESMEHHEIANFLAASVFLLGCHRFPAGCSILYHRLQLRPPHQRRLDYVCLPFFIACCIFVQLLPSAFAIVSAIFQDTLYVASLVYGYSLLLTTLVDFLQHAFWLIYKKMKAEEMYGRGGYRCESSCRLLSC